MSPRMSAVDLRSPMMSAACKEVAKEFGTPSYIYFVDHLVDRVRSLRQAYGRSATISYAVKANPNREILKRMRALVDHLDISSGGELLLALEAGWSPGALTFVGPAKAEWEIRLAVEAGCGYLIAESEAELAQISTIASALDVESNVLLRINPMDLPRGFGVSMSRRATIFGIDEEHIDSAIELANSLPNIDLQGFHVYAGTQCLNEESIIENITNVARLYSVLIERHRIKARRLIFGAGFGIPYHDNENAIDLGEIAKATAPIFEELAVSSLVAGGEISLEMGRFLMGECGVFLAQVVNRKATRGTEILAIDGGMNNFLGASGNLGSVLKRNYPVCNVSRPAAGELREYEIAGPLCTNIDTLGRGVRLPPTERGDLIAVGCGGAYGLTASPVYFISHRLPREIVAEIRDDRFEFLDVSDSGVPRTLPDWGGDWTRGD